MATGVDHSKDGRVRNPAIIRALSIIYRLVDITCFCLLNIIIAVVFVGVIARYVFNSSFSWTEEFSSWCFVWLIFAGMTAGHRGQRHITAGVFEPKHKSVVLVTRFVIDLILGYTLSALIFGGRELIDNIGGISTALQWPNQIKYWIIPVACFISALSIVGEEYKSRGTLASIMSIGALIISAIIYQIIDNSSMQPFAGMSPSMVMGVAFFATLIFGVPIGYAMIFSTFLANWSMPLLPVPAAIHSMVGGGSSFVLLAIPFFLTAGYLMNTGGLSTRIIDFASALVGHWRGGLAQANVVHSVMLGGICGSSSADAASTTKILVPEMVKRGYTPSFACAVTAVGSILPSCFPPSIAMLIYAAVAEVSVAQLFTAGIVPGIMLAGLMCIAVHYIAGKRGYEPAKQRATFKVIMWTGFKAIPAFGLAIAILTLLRFGVVTATEVGVIAVLWSLILGMYFYKAISWKNFYDDLVECSVDSALIGFLIAVSVPFAWVLIAEQVPQLIASSMKSYADSVWAMLLMVNILMLIAGTVLEVVPIMLIMVPLFAPVLIGAGVDPIHLGVIIVINSVLGAVTEPVGILVFICASIAKVPANEVFKETRIFILACAIGLALITFVPEISLTLWTLIGH